MVGVEPCRRRAWERPEKILPGRLACTFVFETFALKVTVLRPASSSKSQPLQYNKRTSSDTGNCVAWLRRVHNSKNRYRVQSTNKKSGLYKRAAAGLLLR